MMFQPIKKIISALLGSGLLYLTTMPATADPEAVMNKAWWDIQPTNVRDNVVSGLFEGFKTGFIFGYKITGKNTEPITPYEDYANFSHSLHFYEDAINDFYSTYPADAKVTIGWILACNADKALLSCDTLAKNFSMYFESGRDTH